MHRNLTKLQLCSDPQDHPVHRCPENMQTACSIVKVNPIIVNPLTIHRNHSCTVHPTHAFIARLSTTPTHSENINVLPIIRLRRRRQPRPRRRIPVRRPLNRRRRAWLRRCKRRRLTSPSVAVPGAAHEPLHERDVIVLGHVAVFLGAGAVVRRHRLDELFDEFVGDEGVPEIEFGDVGLVIDISF